MVEGLALYLSSSNACAEDARHPGLRRDYLTGVYFIYDLNIDKPDLAHHASVLCDINCASNARRPLIGLCAEFVGAEVAFGHDVADGGAAGLT